MSRKYKFHKTDTLYFITYTVILWIDLFTRPEYYKVMIDSWNYCVKNKGLTVHAWCIMPSHVHMIVSSSANLSGIIRDMKRHTSKHLRQTLQENSKDKRKDWILYYMKEEGSRNRNNKGFQLWQQNNHPIELVNNFLINQKLDYIHNNPVKEGIVNSPEKYVLSSAKDYYGKKGLVEIELLG